MMNLLNLKVKTQIKIKKFRKHKFLITITFLTELKISKKLKNILFLKKIKNMILGSFCCLWTMYLDLRLRLHVSDLFYFFIDQHSFIQSLISTYTKFSRFCLCSTYKVYINTLYKLKMNIKEADYYYEK